MQLRTDPHRNLHIRKEPSDLYRFGQINTYSFILPQIHKDTLTLTQNHATLYRSTEIRSDTLRSVPIYKESHIIEQIHKDKLRLTQSCYFVQIHTEPYISTDPYRSTQIRYQFTSIINGLDTRPTSWRSASTQRLKYTKFSSIFNAFSIFRQID